MTDPDFEAFVLRSAPSLLYTAWLLTGDRGHAEDILQNALIRVAQNWSRVRSTPEGYARRAVINAAHDRHRWRRARVVEVSTERLPDRSTDETAGPELREALLEGLRLLTSRQRSVLVLRYVLDLDERATADALGVSVGTVKSTASRGLARMRELAPGLALTEESR